MTIIALHTFIIDIKRKKKKKKSLNDKRLSPPTRPDGRGGSLQKRLQRTFLPLRGGHMVD
jgi:hypothetical protein